MFYEIMTGRVYKEEEYHSTISNMNKEWMKEFLQKYLSVGGGNNNNNTNYFILISLSLTQTQIHM